MARSQSRAARPASTDGVTMRTPLRMVLFAGILAGQSSSHWQRHNVGGGSRARRGGDEAAVDRVQRSVRCRSATRC